VTSNPVTDGRELARRRALVFLADKPNTELSDVALAALLDEGRRFARKSSRKPQTQTHEEKGLD
jgi:hypothetical protein